MLFYLPLEPYKERYTYQMSAPVTGWFERNWILRGVPYVRIDGEKQPQSIRTGVVLDAVGRSRYAFSQVDVLLGLLEQGALKNDDVIYLDDFWHPGIEALPYAFHLFGIKPKAYAFLWAQSVDEFDFTYPMRKWMRFFEKGIGSFLDGIFVCSTILKDLLVWSSVAPAEKIHVVGLPFCSEEVQSRMSSREMRQNKVVFSSRWDKEKNPDFFLKVARRVLAVDPSVLFMICTGSQPIRSNSSRLLADLDAARRAFPNNIEVMEGLTKEQYYHELCTAKVQINTADQDFVSFTLLEASAAGCFPVYPYFRSFPETLRNDPRFFYERLNIDSAVDKVLAVLAQDVLWTDEAIAERSWIHERYDTTWERMLQHMGVLKGVASGPY